MREIQRPGSSFRTGGAPSLSRSVLFYLLSFFFLSVYLSVSLSPSISISVRLREYIRHRVASSSFANRLRQLPYSMVLPHESFPHYSDRVARVSAVGSSECETDGRCIHTRRDAGGGRDAQQRRRASRRARPAKRARSGAGETGWIIRKKTRHEETTSRDDRGTYMYTVTQCALLTLPRDQK